MASKALAQKCAELSEKMGVKVYPSAGKATLKWDGVEFQSDADSALDLESENSWTVRYYSKDCPGWQEYGYSSCEIARRVKAG